MNHEQACELIFISGLSTSDKISDISGRGVGMAAVRTAVEQVGGTLTLTSTPNKGTTFTIAIPKTGDAEILCA